MPPERPLWYAVPGTERGVKPNELTQYIGKEMAEKLLAQPTGAEGAMNVPWHTLSGLENMKVGGEGMRSFYGDFSKEGKYDPGIVGTRLLKLVKGLDPEAAKIEGHLLFGEGYEPNAAQIAKIKANPSLKETWLKGDYAREYPSIPITPKLREALKKGLPLFSLAPAALLPNELGLTPPEHGSDGYPASGPDEELFADGGSVEDMLRKYYGGSP